MGWVSFSHLTRARRSLEKLAAKIMEQAGVLEIGSPKEASFIRIKKFADQFFKADSHEEDIRVYEAELTIIMDEVKVRRRGIVWTKLTFCGRRPSRYILPLPWIESIKRQTTRRHSYSLKVSRGFLSPVAH